MKYQCKQGWDFVAVHNNIINYYCEYLPTSPSVNPRSSRSIRTRAPLITSEMIMIAYELANVIRFNKIINGNQEV